MLHAIAMKLGAQGRELIDLGGGCEVFGKFDSQSAPSANVGLAKRANILLVRPTLGRFRSARLVRILTPREPVRWSRRWRIRSGCPCSRQRKAHATDLPNGSGRRVMVRPSSIVDAAP